MPERTPEPVERAAESVPEAPPEPTPKDQLEMLSDEVLTVANFLNEEGAVNIERAEKYKNVLSSSILETLNQLKPGILFELYVKVEGDRFEIDFAGNDDADRHIGLSQMLRGTPKNSTVGGRLEGIRSILLTDTEGAEVESERKGAAGNFYAEGVYQDVHTGFSLKVVEFDKNIDQKIASAQAAAREKASRVPADFFKDAGWEGISAATLKWDPEKGEFVAGETASESQFIEYLMMEAELQGVDPYLALAVVKAGLGPHVDRHQFENMFQWSVRGLQVYQNEHGDLPTKDDDLAVYVARIVEFPVALEVIGHEKLLAAYGALVGKKLTLAYGVEIHEHGHEGEELELAGLSGLRELVPQAYRISSGYGFRGSIKLPNGKILKPHRHNGLDIPAPMGSPINAYADGVVKKVGLNHRSAGNYLEIDHGGGFVTRYVHCSSINVREGQRVQKGEVVAAIGSTGNSTGPHLHFEVRRHGVARNPARYLSGEASVA